MKLIIQIKEKKISLVVWDSKKEIDRLEFSEEHNLSERLLLTIDELLRRNFLESRDLEKVEVLSDQSDSFTTTRIALATANALNWANNSGREQGGGLGTYIQTNNATPVSL